MKLYLDDLARSQLQPQQLVFVNIGVKHLGLKNRPTSHMRFPTVSSF